MTSSPQLLASREDECMCVGGEFMCVCGESTSVGGESTSVGGDGGVASPIGRRVHQQKVNGE
eukprot:CAMPEP_0198215094 /NCGR_PEP_ID=MMETSP1445-20131203/47030_1 /TAXON_ID=36898 /ORGANISM="Pyramimonas sp., Strain CCMP2087" /LENGTH=61 /DNA_ID=CAMNT_0043890643 /DNA_START=145 /DNA_END=331 /DNA_ORIENTATION=+